MIKKIMKEELDREEKLRTEHAQLIRTVAKAAINRTPIDSSDIQMLSKLGLLKASTKFRSEILFPDESAILLYNFIENEIIYAGYIGFDINLQLISIDEFFPRKNRVYLKVII
ncbi:MAG: hypothetical protein HYW71_02390 [Candidatus Niyogibacteria bacterium]|nr:hypothetical protein [Candidatus Niyogibacteria bacterium]